MVDHSILVFFAFLVVLVTFQPRRRRRVVPYVPFDIVGGHPVRRLLPFLRWWRGGSDFRVAYGGWSLANTSITTLWRVMFWHTSPQMLNLRYWQTYRMEFLAFETLVDLLTPFLHPTAATFVRPPVPVRKQVKLVLYRLAHGVSCARMHNLYGCGESTIRKYTMIVCRALGSGENDLFFQFIHTPSGNMHQSIIKKFRNITRLPNIAGAIDDIHIP